MSESSTRLRGVRRLLCNIFLLSLPFATIIGSSYLIFDPFRILYHYSAFDKPQVVPLNRDYISTQMYLNTYERRHYRSFILGNSRTIAFRIRDWEPYIHDTLAFHYDASGESLYGVWKKLQFLEDHHAALDNVLLICDADLLAKTDDSNSHLFRKDPRLTGSSSAEFQLLFLKAYLSNRFFYQFLKQRQTGVFTPEMAAMLESRHIYYDPITNDLELSDINQEIKRDSVGFYARNERLKGIRRPGMNSAVISAAQLRQLVAVRNILVRHRTNYHIVISPLFNQRRLNPSDLALLQRVFSAARIHDYSGVNEFTSQLGNYYEASHYRPHVGRTILKQIYR